ncbi:MAG: HD domain-containing protein [Planctomycetota bacterium]
MNYKRNTKRQNPLKLRKNIAIEAAKLLYDQLVTDFFSAKQKAARLFDVDEKTFSLPSDQEIRMEVLKIANLQESYLQQKQEEPISETDYDTFYSLLLPLEEVKGRFRHPEGDFLFHSLQVFELARLWHGYDFDFLLAALLHDVGRGIDFARHEEAGAYVLEGLVSERVLFLVRHHEDATQLKLNQLGHKRRILLKGSPYFEDLMILQELDQKGREPGAPIDTLEEALNYLKILENESLL